jgi:hypothetical protein
MGWFRRSAAWSLPRQLAMAAAVIAAGAAAIGVGVGTTRSLTTATAVAPGTVGATTGQDSVTSTGPRSGTAEPATTVSPGSTADVASTGTSGESPTPVPSSTSAPTATSTADRPYGSVSPSGDLRARDVLDTIPVALERQGGYDRDFFPTWARTAEAGCDVRDVVLMAESVTPVDRRAPCTIVSGTWLSAYDGATLTQPSTVEIDHVVSLKEAWDSGAWAWTAERRVAFANDLSDPRTLIAVSGSSNGSKADKDPSNWLPRSDDVCRFLADWVAIKARWGLAMDESEWGRVKNQLEGPCAGTAVAPWPVAP